MSLNYKLSGKEQKMHELAKDLEAYGITVRHRPHESDAYVAELNGNFIYFYTFNDNVREIRRYASTNDAGPFIKILTELGYTIEKMEAA